ncbi:MAG: T9SS type A sorting domain-containing protein [Bacteroidales bacterium]|nr:T9SS type A sorting domain-containing protein [Bacteroidales bacterium]MBN2697463.1 T9SS type A sorting domain-containing protein [Bacteroidales bacterium]
MKWVMPFLIFLVLRLTFAQSQDTIVEIPDISFLNALINQGLDTNGDGLISYAEARTIHCLYVEEMSISDLTGIEAFTNLDTLLCYCDELTSLNVSNNTALTFLNCSGNKLASLDVSNITALMYLNCADNQLTSLDVSSNTLLTHLYCSNNQLATLDVSNNPGLIYFYCGGNDLVNLDVSGNTCLEELYCGCISNYLFGCDPGQNHNRISSLDVSANKNLKMLECDGNELSSLDLSNNTLLTELSCRENNITSLDVLNNKALMYLDCSRNQIVNLDVSGNNSLIDLYCEMNYLKSLDLSNDTALNRLFCSNNQLSSLDLTNNAHLRYLFCGTNNLINLNLTKNQELLALHCDTNPLTTLDISNNISMESFACYKHIWCSIGIYTSNLNISNMPALSKVCVWESFTPESIIIDSANSPAVIFTVDCATGFENQYPGSISICPNPTSNFLTIETDLSGLHSIEIFHMNGQIIYGTSMENTSYQIDLSSFSTGIYIILIRSKDFVITEKVIKL